MSVEFLLTLIVVVLLPWPVSMTWLKRTFAGTFGFLGLRLALSDR